MHQTLFDSHSITDKIINNFQILYSRLRIWRIFHIQLGRILNGSYNYKLFFKCLLLIYVVAIILIRWYAQSIKRSDYKIKTFNTFTFVHLFLYETLQTCNLMITWLYFKECSDIFQSCAIFLETHFKIWIFRSNINYT